MVRLHKQKITHALLSVQDKQGLASLARVLQRWKIKLYGSQGTQAFLAQQGISIQGIASLTGENALLGGRVKTLHPHIFSGILYRREVKSDVVDIKKRRLPSFDLVVVNLYPFADTLRQGGTESALIEHIDIGGVALVRAAAKNYAHVGVVCKTLQYETLIHWLDAQKGRLTLAQRRQLACEAFAHSAQYDTMIATGLLHKQYIPLKEKTATRGLRYGENPHQKATFYGSLESILQPIQGSAMSYNNLLDAEAALHLLAEFKGRCACAIIKHSNPCGFALGDTPYEAFQRALACDKLSAFGGVFAFNQSLDEATAQALSSLFFELVIAPGYTSEALAVFLSHKKRKVLRQNGALPNAAQWRSVLNGVLMQTPPSRTQNANEWEVATFQKPTLDEKKDLLFALKVVKHVKSNAIVLARHAQVIGCGGGQTSRIDALQIAIRKAKRAAFDLTEAVLASEAFFPFPDSVELAHNEGIKTFVQPGGSIGDKKVIQYCDEHHLKMCFTHQRYFKH